MLSSFGSFASLPGARAGEQRLGHCSFELPTSGLSERGVPGSVTESGSIPST